jgi:hypothetical protein
VGTSKVKDSLKQGLTSLDCVAVLVFFIGRPSCIKVTFTKHSEIERTEERKVSEEEQNREKFARKNRIREKIAGRTII